MKKDANVSTAFLYQLLNAGIFASAVLLGFSDLFGISEVGWKHMTALIITIILFSAVRLLTGRQQVYAAVIGLVVLVSFSGEIRWEEEIYLQLVKVFFLAVISYFLQLVAQKSVILKMATSAAAAGWLLYALFRKQQMSQMAVIFFILYIALSMVDWIRAGLNKMKDENAQAFTLGIMPFLMIYFILLCFMPVREEPYHWQWVRDIYRSAEEKVVKYTENLWHSGSEYFGGGVSGFSEEGVLLPGITRTDRQLMTLQIRNQRDMPIYLAGKVFDSFDGQKWLSQGKGSESERILDVLETVYALESYAEKNEWNHYRNVQMEIKYRYFHTDYLLSPIKTWKIEGERIKYRQEDTDILFERKAGYGTEYLLRFFQMNMDREEWYRFLAQNQVEDEKVWEKTVRQYSEESIALKELYEYRTKIKQRYLPETHISPEVKAWISDVASGAKSDVEKLRSIESALSDMRYNVDPGKLPETVTDEKSFLDYFLMEKKEGYCAYFATAFVLLARAEGFPARYVQGFCVPAVSGRETPVYSYMAHSWPEVYIEGKGWIPFEPTPGFLVNRYTVWEEPANINNKAPKVQEDIEEDIMSEVISEEEMSEEVQSRWLSYAGRVILVLLAGLILAFAAEWLSEGYREKRRESSEKYRLAVLHNLRILNVMGYGREPDETFHELVERIRRDSAKEEVIPCGFIETYENILYGTLQIDEQIWKEVLEERERLLEILKNKKGKKYVICRVRLYFAKMIQK